MALLGLIFYLLPSKRVFSGLRPSNPWRPFFGLLLFVFFFGASLGVQAQESKEYELKAAFLFNFAQFVKWPANSFPSTDAPFYIGILGDNPFGSALEETIRGETVDNHKLKIVRGQNIDDLKECQMIFIPKSEEDHVAEILSKVGSRPILTVSEVENFAEHGGNIDFYLSDGKVRFEINPQSAQRCGLKISSQLLSLGKIVAGGN